MQNMVRFPLMGMDMAPHVVKRSQSSWSLPSHWSPWRRPYGLGRNPDDFLYDLYAVCNHHGNMHGGHYTGNATDRGSSLEFGSQTYQGKESDHVVARLSYSFLSPSQPTVRTPSMASGTVSTTARFHRWLTTTCVSRRPTSCSTSEGRLSPRGRPTALWLVGVCLFIC